MRKSVLFFIIALILVLSACSEKPKGVSDEFLDEAIQITLFIDDNANTAKTEDWNNLISGLDGDTNDHLTQAEQEIKAGLLNLASTSNEVAISRDDHAVEVYEAVYDRVESLLGQSTLDNAELDNEKLAKIIDKYREIGWAKKREEKTKEIQEEMAVKNEIDRIKNSNPTIGMTKEEVEMSLWGKPQKVNRTVSKYGVREQWVYPDYKYLYFEDGILTSFQD